MDSKIRSIRDLGGGILVFCFAVPDPSPGPTALVTDLQHLIALIDQHTGVQQQGQADARIITVAKQQLLATLNGQLRHFRHVGVRASQDLPDLAQKLSITPRPTSHRVLRNAARAVQGVVTPNKDQLTKYGMSETVRTEFDGTLDQLDKLLDQSESARVTHVGASAELEVLGRQAVQVMRVLDTVYRSRFRNDPEQLAKWESASSGLRSLYKGRGTPSTPVSGSAAEKPAA